MALNNFLEIFWNNKKPLSGLQFITESQSEPCVKDFLCVTTNLNHIKRFIPTHYKTFFSFWRFYGVLSAFLRHSPPRFLRSTKSQNENLFHLRTQITLDSLRGRDDTAATKIAEGGEASRRRGRPNLEGFNVVRDGEMFWQGSCQPSATAK